ncbi:MAG: UPF0104 family protein [Nocardioidaceae bacterium]|nr:UPF0104 family protein [Nocardioidaceae bacterium]
MLGLAGRATLVTGVLVAGLWTATHQVAGVSWAEVGSLLTQVPVGRLVLLTALWLGGLAIYAVVLASALPGLGYGRSLLLNLSGSAVSNVVPLGGAAGTALNWRMVTRWGYSNASFVAFCVLTNLLDVLTKLVLPLVAVGGLLLVSVHVPRMVWTVAGACAAALVVVVLLPLLSRWFGPLRRLDRLRGSVVRVRDLLQERWAPLLAGSAAYIAAQVLLLDVSLHTVGLQPALAVVVTAAALERLATLVPVTPGGAGVAELGAIAWLVAAGLPPVGVVAGVVLCRVFLVVLEVPLGGALLAGWAWHVRRGAAVPRLQVGA